jgi:hypothetical protein
LALLSASAGSARAADGAGGSPGTGAERHRVKAKPGKKKPAPARKKKRSLAVRVRRTHAHASLSKPVPHGSVSKHDPAPEFPPGADATPGSRYANLEGGACLSELQRRDIHVVGAGPSPGVAIPVRLAGPVGGVLFRTDYPDSQRGKVPYEVFDCRLVLSLSDFAAVLKEHDVTEVRLFSAWRPVAHGGHGVGPGDAAGAHTGHPSALAADLRLFKKASGEELSVEPSFHGRIGAPPCGPAAVPPSPPTADAVELRSILCAAADARLFHVLLSPNFDYPHRNHFHVEVRPGVTWFIVR